MADRAHLGGCLCGAVRFVARNAPRKIGICHCDMCRRWTGSALVEVSLHEGDVEWQGADFITRYVSSPWAERGFCSRCGTGLFFRMTEENAFSGGIDLPLGIFDDPNGFEISHEIFIDQKPDSFAFAGGPDRKQLTRAECVAKFPRLDSQVGAKHDHL